MGEFGSWTALTRARGTWLFDRIVETGSVVLSVVGGDHAGTTAGRRYLASPQSSVATILSALRERTMAACRGRRVVSVADQEADLSEHFADHAVRAAPGGGLLIPARHDRGRADAGCLAGLADRTVSVPATPGHVRLPRPGNAGSGTPAVRDLGLARVDEIEGPSWHLLTTLPVETSEPVRLAHQHSNPPGHSGAAQRSPESRTAAGSESCGTGSASLCMT